MKTAVFFMAVCLSVIMTACETPSVSLADDEKSALQKDASPVIERAVKSELAK